MDAAVTAGPLKVLLSAYACEPRRGSEPAVGWNLALGMARHHDVWVITRASNQPAIEAELAHSAVPAPRFAYVDLPRWIRSFKRGRLGLAVYYDLWQLAALRSARELHARIGFDLAQHVTFVKYTAPSLLASLPVPFIWGPVGGGESMPRAFERELRLGNRVHETARRSVRWLGERDPRVRATAQRCAVALATSEETQERVRALGARDVRVLSQIAAPEDEVATADLPGRTSLQPFRLISVGRLLHWKGFELGLRAFAAARLPHAEYAIIGAGPEREALQQLARRLALGNRVQFAGELPRAQVLERLRRSHLLVHPALHESGGAVCSEAMAAGCPVACLDLGGPALQVQEQHGFRIAARGPDQVVAELAEVMVKLANDPLLFAQKSRAARHAALELSWARKCEQIAELYRSVLERREVESDGRAAQLR